MRLTLVNCIFPLALVATMAFGQQTTPATTKNPPQQSTVKPSTGQSDHAKVASAAKAHHRAARTRHLKASSRRGAKRAAYRPEYTQNSVEVMNGTATQKVVFHNDEPARGQQQKDNAPQPFKVEVVNGTATDTQYFAGNPTQIQPRTAVANRQVVVGIQSSDTRVVGGNKHPVVTGITAVEPGDAKSATGGKNVTTGISPQPKRPAYQPDAH